MVSKNGCLRSLVVACLTSGCLGLYSLDVHLNKQAFLSQARQGAYHTYMAKNQHEVVAWSEYMFDSLDAAQGARKWAPLSRHYLRVDEPRLVDFSVKYL